MSKRKILAAAKKRGITIVAAEYHWVANPGEMVPQWSIMFGPELDKEFEEFSTSAEAIEYIENAEIVAPRLQKLVINVCHQHNYYAISIDDDNGGQRITPNKCCGSWTTLKAWDLSAHDWRELAKLAEYAATEKEKR